MLVICLLNNIVLRGREFFTSSIAKITGNVPRLLADIVRQSAMAKPRKFWENLPSSYALPDTGLCKAYLIDVD